MPSSTSQVGSSNSSQGLAAADFAVGAHPARPQRTCRLSAPPNPPLPAPTPAPGLPRPTAMEPCPAPQGDVGLHAKVHPPDRATDNLAHIEQCRAHRQPAFARPITARSHATADRQLTTSRVDRPGRAEEGEHGSTEVRFPARMRYGSSWPRRCKPRRSQHSSGCSAAW